MRPALPFPFRSELLYLMNIACLTISPLQSSLSRSSPRRLPTSTMRPFRTWTRRLTQTRPRCRRSTPRSRFARLARRLLRFT